MEKIESCSTSASSTLQPNFSNPYFNLLNEAFCSANPNPKNYSQNPSSQSKASEPKASEKKSFIEDSSIKLRQ